MRTVIGLPLSGCLPSSRACATSSRETFFSMCSTCVMKGFQNFFSGTVQSSSPRDTASSSSSSEAVKPYSTYLWKCLERKLPTILPMSVGMNRRLSMSTYSRSLSVEMMVA